MSSRPVSAAEWKGPVENGEGKARRQTTTTPRYWSDTIRHVENSAVQPNFFLPFSDCLSLSSLQQHKTLLALFERWVA